MRHQTPMLASCAIQIRPRYKHVLGDGWAQGDSDGCALGDGDECAQSDGYKCAQGDVDGCVHIKGDGCAQGWMFI